MLRVCPRFTSYGRGIFCEDSLAVDAKVYLEKKRIDYSKDRDRLKWTGLNKGRVYTGFHGIDM